MRPNRRWTSGDSILGTMLAVHLDRCKRKFEQKCSICLTCFGLIQALFAAVLCRFFITGMIFQRYSRKIIGDQINAVQTSSKSCIGQSIVSVSILCCSATVSESYPPATTIESYFLPTIPESYFQSAISETHLVATASESYLQAASLEPPVAPLWAFGLLLPLAGLAHSTDSSTLSDFAVDARPDEQTTTESNGSENPPATDLSSIAAYGYARQSQSNSNTEDENGEPQDTSSIKAQKKNIHAVADDEVDGQVKVFTDIDESGFSFDRAGINDLRQRLEQDPKPIILDRINRLGRDTLETIYVAAEIYYTYEVPIITDRYGRYELARTDDQVRLVIEAITAGKSVKDRIQAAWDAINSNFREDRNWYSWFGKIRVGYQEDSDGWVEPVPGGEEVMSAIMQDFCKLRGYAPLIDLIQTSAKHDAVTNPANREYQLNAVSGETITTVFEKSDFEIESLTGQQLKDLLSERIYVGEVRYPKTADPDEQEVIEDSELRLVEDSLYERVTQTKAGIGRTNSASEETVDVQTLADLGLLVKATEESDCFKPTCSRCNRGMVKNGETTLSDGRRGHYWICPNYGESGEHDQRKYPYDSEWDALQREISEDQGQGSQVIALRICQIETESADEAT